MANTQGLSDSDVSRLLSNEVPEEARASRQRGSLARRLDMPIGENPAARVVRSSDRSRAPMASEPVSVTSTTNPKDANRPQSVSVDAIDESAVVGGIVERKRSSRKTKPQWRPHGGKASNRKQSRFAAERDPKSSMSTGFPSFNVQVGTFTKTRRERGSTRVVDEPSERAAPNRSSSTAEESLRDAASKDADAQIRLLTMKEVAESVQEIKSTLSPELVDFLRRRGRGGNALGRPLPAKPCSPGGPSETRRKTATVADAKTTNKDDQEEKERLASVVSAIRTFEDLDAAYAQEMGKDPIEAAEAGGDDEVAELRLACDLLRSSSRRQTLWAAKLLSKRLRMDVVAARQSSADERPELAPQWSYPDLLPVSLRCLLDAPPTSNGYVLHTYALQSIYSLLQLRACPDHYSDIDNDQENDCAVLQLHCMDDWTPSPRLGCCYISTPVATVTDGNNQSVAAYSSSSSTESARSDSEAFRRDPMWTLVSRMRIIPKLAQFLRSNGSLPIEGIVATCGILSLIGQRSPGAASAIVQHETILQDLLHIAFGSNEASPRCDAIVGLPVVLLMCALARQSRAAAEGLPIDVTLFRVLSTSPSNDIELRLHQWTLILWRTVLRYGAGISHLQFCLSISVQHLSIGVSDYCLAGEFYSSFACVLRCARVRIKQMKDEADIEHEGLGKAGAWLSGTAREALRHLSKEQVALGSLEGKAAIDCLHLCGSCLVFVDSFLSLQRQSDSTTEIEYKMDDLTLDEEAGVVDALLEMILTKRFLDLVAYVFPPILLRKQYQRSGSASFDAAACGFLKSLISLTTSLRDQQSTQQLVNDKLDKLVHGLSRALLEAVDAFDFVSHADEISVSQKSLRPWSKRLLTAVAAFLSSTNAHTKIAQSIHFLALGHLGSGDEAAAAILLSSDRLLLPEDSKFTSSPLSTMLMRQLCESAEARLQLDHSFKLRGGFGITSSGSGPLDLNSLRCEHTGRARSTQLASSLLPMGELWLWQLLAGTVMVDDTETAPHGNHLMEAREVIVTSLQLITDMEFSDDAFTRTVAESFDNGRKLYHLVNTCFQPEIVLRDKHFQKLMGRLIDKYLAIPGAWVDSFASTCNAHASTSTPNKGPKDESSPIPAGHSTAAADRALQNYVCDLCDTYIQYGAQYISFSRCVRIFLLPCFPPKIRCEVLQRLSGLTHLLTVEEDTTMELLLRPYICEKLPALESFAVDPPEVVDALCATFTQHASARLDGGLVSHLATALLAKTIATNLGTWSCLSSINRQRIEKIDRELAVHVLQTTALFLSNSDLLLSTLESTKRRGDRTLANDLLPVHGERWDEAKWRKIETYLKRPTSEAGGDLP